MRFLPITALAALLTLAGAACGDDDNDDGDASSGDAAAYCAVSAELDSQEGELTVEQLDELDDAAPEEIRDEVEFVTERLRDGIEAGDIEAAFGDPEIGERFETIEAFEEEHCPQAEGAQGDEAPDPDATQVAVVGTEYAFEVDTTLAAGPTAFTFDNAGEEEHEMFVVRLVEGASLDDALAADDPEALTEEEIGVAVVDPGEQGFLNADLVPGTYGMVCFIPDADGEPHAMLGMVAELVVTGA